MEVVCGISINSEGIFIARRNPDKANGGLWEFPGGKVEEEEKREDALRRELKEELNVEVRIGKYIGCSEVEGRENRIVLHAYLVDFVTEPNSSTDHDHILRTQIDRLQSFKMCESDVHFINIVRSQASRT